MPKAQHTRFPSPPSAPVLRYAPLLLLLCLVAGPGRAQPTNLEAFQELARRCLAAAPDTARAFRLQAPDQMPYLRTALAATWRQAGRTIFLPDTTAPARALPTLHYQIESVGIAYTRARRKRLDRAVTLALRYTFTAPDGRLLDEHACRDTYTDTILRREHPALENEAFPETLGTLPEAGWLRRYLEPAVLTAATAVTVFLFFSLRSDRTDSGS